MQWSISKMKQFLHLCPTTYSIKYAFRIKEALLYRCVLITVESMFA